MTLEAPVRSFVSCSCCSSNGSNAAGLRDQFTAESSANAKLLFLVHLVLLYPPPRQHSGYPVGLTRHRSALRVVRWIDIYLPRRREGSLLGKTIVGTLSCSSADIIESTKRTKGVQSAASPLATHLSLTGSTLLHVSVTSRYACESCKHRFHISEYLRGSLFPSS